MKYDLLSGNRNIRRSQGFNVTHLHFYEGPVDDPDVAEVWCYTDQLSYEAGDTVDLHLSTTASSVSLSIYRDDIKADVIYEARDVAGKHYETPEDFYSEGCGWPVGHRWQIPEDQRSGFYLVVCTIEDAQGQRIEHEAGFFVRPKVGQPTAKMLLIAATSTWTTYNDWGGYSRYAGHCEGFDNGMSPRLTIHRPWARGFLFLPDGAPRQPHEHVNQPGQIPRYPVMDFSFANGYSRYYASAGWASYERPFCIWAESQGFRLDYATQHDLHYTPELLSQYACVVLVGHDEYWTWEMREAIDAYVDQGGHLARFGGNFCQQVRLEDDGRTQVCYSEKDAFDHDPVARTDQKHLTTTVWEAPLVGWNGAATVGLNGLQGIYAGIGHLAPNQGGSFTVYREDHWVFEGTDLCYGDQFGGDARIFGYEVDGLDYTFEYGLPEPTYKDSALPGTLILAMGLASNRELDRGHKGTVRRYGDNAVPEFAYVRYGETSQEAIEGSGRGSGMIVICPRGKGQIFNAGSCEWVAGLKLRDMCTEIITRNVLNRFT